MKFPYPENVDAWQTAYTRDDAYADSDKHAQRSGLALIFGVLIISGYLFIYFSKFDIISALSPLLKIVFFIVLVVVVFALLAVVQSAAFRFAAAFLNDFYLLPEGIDAAKILNNRLYGKLKLPPPLNMFFRFEYIIAKEGEIAKADQWPAWSARHLGGPMLLIVFDGCALYLERGNRFSRVIGPSDKAFLEWYETIKYVVDLRPKIKEGEVDAWTKDGINIRFKIQIECRIGDPKKIDPDSNLVYPYDSAAVKQAIERHAVRWPNRLEGEPSEFTWVDAAWGQVTGIVPAYIGSRMLDDLFIADRNGGQILSPNAVQDIFKKLNQETQKFSVFVTDFQVSEVKLPPEVETSQKELWKAEKQSLVTVKDGQLIAFNIRSQEQTRAKAQRDLILNIADGLEKSQDGKYIEPLLLTFSRILDESLNEPLMRAYLAKETLETLEKIKEMLK